MFKQLRALAGAITGQNGLVGCVRNYPPYQAPHHTGGAFLGLESLQENLAHFIESRSSRLEEVTRLLQAQGLDVSPALNPGEDPLPFLDAMDSWVTQLWSTGPIEKQYLFHRFWTEHCDDGTSSLYGFLSDIGLLLGEILIAHRPISRWGFDLNARNREHSSDVNRIIIVGMAVPDNNTIPSYYDPAHSAFSALRLVQNHPEPRMHGLTTNIRARIAYYPALSATPAETD